MERINVLIVDQSDRVRESVKRILSHDVSFSVAGEARDGKEGLEKAFSLRPDIIVMEIDLPIIGGMEFIERIMAEMAVPILVVSPEANAGLSYAAISKGALDVIPRSELDPKDSATLIKKIRLLSKVKVIKHIGGRHDPGMGFSPKKTWERHGGEGKIVAVASSTGGPKALSMILPKLPADLPAPVVVAQHMSDGFVPGMVKWLKDISKIRVKVGEGGEALSPATVYFSPSERHMAVDGKRRLYFIERRPADIYHPSCDLLLSSAADAYGGDSIGVVLTGMGHDGMHGLRKIKEAGGATIAQDERTSLIYGMPKAAVESGFVDTVLPLEGIVEEIARLAALKEGSRP